MRFLTVALQGFTLEVALASSYVWRGQVLNNDTAVQSQITLAQYGFSVNMWSNYDIGSNKDGVKSDMSEFDFLLHIRYRLM